MPLPTDTIVAIASARGAAARGIVRLSGPVALEAASRRFTPDPGAPAPGRLRFAATEGRLLLRPGAAVPACLLVMRAPHSFTREDVVEIHLTGGPALLDLVLRDLVGFGIRPAEPGEFTRRAFLNGRIDLSAAEAVAALVAASTAAEHRAAARGVAGALSRAVAGLCGRVLDLLATVELDLDFSDQDVPAADPAEILRRTAALRGEVASLLARRPGPAASRGEIRALLVGRPNAGKSSLMNRLLGRERVLVSEIPGTTRDVVEDVLVAGGRRLVLCDTAGVGGGGEAAERLAAPAREAAAEAADILVHVADARGGVPAIPVDPSGRPVLTVLTHIDTIPGFAPPAEGVLGVSNVTGEGIARVQAGLLEALSVVPGAPEGPVLVSERQEACAREALECLGRTEDCLRGGGGLELAAEDLRGAVLALSDLRGQDASTAVLDRVFRDFCIGK